MLAEGRRAVVVALPAWLASRVLVVVALLVTRGLHGGYPRAGAAPGAHGWWAWDAGWYRAIAEHGYPRSGGEELRFFPLLPLLGRGVDVWWLVNLFAWLVIFSAGAMWRFRMDTARV